MLFAIGTKVRLKHTGDEGVVRDILDGDMLSVYIARDDMEIPVFVDDLENTADFFKKKAGSRTTILIGKQIKKAPIPERPVIESQYAILKSMGIQLAFDGQVDGEGITKSYDIYLINDTKDNVIFSISMSVNGYSKFKHHGTLNTVTAQLIDKMMFDQLNDLPVFEIECWRVTTLGTEARLHKTIKLKPKQFFKNLKTAPILNRQVHHYKVFEKLEYKGKNTGEEDLKDYTRRHIDLNNVTDQMSNYRLYDQNDIRAVAAFVPEIDLHIQNLVDNPKSIPRHEILKTQLEYFDRFMQDAIRYDVPSVFIIHGLGKGRLRDSIATRLIQYREVKTFKNEYHHKYGWGATEVLFV